MRRLLLAITTWEWLLLLLLLPLIVFTSSVGALALLILPLFWVIRKAATGHFFPRTPYNAAILVLATAVLISFLAVFDIALSFPKIAGVVFGIALYFAAVEQCRQRENGVWLILAAVALVGTAIAVLSVFFATWSGPFRFLAQAKDLLPLAVPALPGAVSGVINPNELAGVLAWIVPLLAAVLFGYRRDMWHANRRGSRLLLLALAACLLINTFVLLATWSRGGLVSVFVAVLVMLAIEFSWGRWLLLIGLLGGLALLISSGPDVLLGAPSAAIESFGLQARLEIWSRGLYALEDFPFTGVSMNGFRRIVHVLYPLFSIGPGTDIGHVHNHLLQAGLDLGIMGLIAYLALWFLSGALLWKGLRNKSEPAARMRPLQVGLAGSLAAGWFFGIVDVVALGARPGFIWWLLIALVAVSTTAVFYSASQEH